MRTEEPDFALLHTDSRLEYGRRRAGESALDAMKPHITDLATQGMGRVRVFFSGNFDTLAPNPLADRVLSSIG